MSGNTTTQTGNLVADPELRFTPSGTPIATFSLAVNRHWQKAGEWQEETSFLDVTCWQGLATNVADSLSKGDRVLVTGRLEQETWEADDGSKRSKVKIVASDVGPSLMWATTVATKNPRRTDAGPTEEDPFA